MASRSSSTPGPWPNARPGDITFVEHERHLAAWHACPAAAAIVSSDVPLNGRPLIRVGDPLMAFAEVIQQLRGRFTPESPTVDPTARVHPTAKLGVGVSVGPYSIIGERSEIGDHCTLHARTSVGRHCQLGHDVILHPHVVLYDHCRLGDRVIVHANAVIGADGFGYRMQNGRHLKVPQLGSVEIENDVEIGACSTIDRGTFGVTRVGTGTKIDNLVMIGHNCQIGKHNILCSQVGIAGSTCTGDYVVMAGQVGVADHLTIGDQVTIGAKSGVPGNIPSKSQVLGIPATPHKEQVRMMLTLEKLPEIRRDVQRIKRHLGLEGD